MSCLGEGGFSACVQEKCGILSKGGGAFSTRRKGGGEVCLIWEREAFLPSREALFQGSTHARAEARSTAGSRRT